MKKTFTINISGIIFHIDEDAYSKLNSYLSTIKTHFNNLEGKEEVISDIESRIAEILQAKLSDTKQVITLEDINDVISTMGQPSDFADDQEEPSSTSYSYQKTGYKRLYRDPENKMIGGVASGIGAYLNVDPIWIRILFIISLFTTLGVFIYIILWIAVPEALTTTERLEMRGEPVNISNIEKSIKEEFDHLKGKINDLTQQAKETYKKKSDIPKTFFENILEFFINIIKMFFKGIVILLGVVILITGLALILAFVGAISGHSLVFFGDPDIAAVPVFQLLDIFLSSSGNIGLLKVGLFFLFAIPLLMLIYWGIRMIFGFERIRHLGSTAFILWLIGLALTITYSFKIYHHFKYEVEDKQEYAIEQLFENELFLETRDLYDYPSQEIENYIQLDDLEIAVSTDAYLINKSRLRISKSYDENISLIRYSTARGKSGFDAKERAEKIEYQFIQNQNHFVFDEFYKIPKKDIWADQQIRLELRVPVGTIIRLDKNMHRILRWNSGYYYYSWSDRDYIMTEDGLEKFNKKIEEEKLEEPKEISQSTFSKMSTKVGTYIGLVINTFAK